MATTGIDAAIRELEKDAERIQQALSILRGLGRLDSAPKTSSGRKRGGPRKLSAAGRRRIAEAAKRRWAAFRAAKK